MSAGDHGKPLRWAVAVVLFAALAVAAFVWRGDHVDVVPEPPTRSAVPISLPATTSHLAVTVSLPTSAIAAHLDAAIPKSFAFDVRNDARVYGNPSRGPLTVSNDVGAGRVNVSAPVGGRVQVEKKIVFVNASVGIDVSGGIGASFSPVVAPNWAISPRLELSAHLDRAVAKTAVGDIDITGHVRGAVSNAINGAQGPAEVQLANALNIHKAVEDLWNQINHVHKLADDPPTWLRITPQKATFGKFTYSADAIASGVALDLESHVFVQDVPPELLKVALPDLNVTGILPDDFDLSLPIEVSYPVLNKELKKQLSKETLKLPEIGAWIAIADATIEAYGDGILLAVDFRGKKGAVQSVSGRLYVVGVPVFDAEKSELRVEDLNYTAATESVLLKSVEWLAHSKLLETMKLVTVVNLSAELEQAKTKANEQLNKLKGQLPKEIGANVSVAEIAIDRLAFANDRAFAIVRVKGKMSAQLKQ